MRHALRDADGGMIDARVENVLATSAAESGREKASSDGVEGFLSEAAQQLSA